MDFKIFVIGAAVLVAGYVMTKPAGGVKGSEAREMVAKGALLLDVRTKDEFAAGHLPAAVNIPVQDLDRRLAEVGAKERPIVVYCRSGQRSRRAAGLLKAAGYGAVHDLGSMGRW